jgi:hypothetical protein
VEEDLISAVVSLHTDGAGSEAGRRESAVGCGCRLVPVSACLGIVDVYSIEADEARRI